MPRINHDTPITNDPGEQVFARIVEDTQPTKKYRAWLTYEVEFHVFDNEDGDGFPEVDRALVEEVILDEDDSEEIYANIRLYTSGFRVEEIKDEDNDG